MRVGMPLSFKYGDVPYKRLGKPQATGTQERRANK